MTLRILNNFPNKPARVRYAFKPYYNIPVVRNRPIDRNIPLYRNKPKDRN